MPKKDFSQVALAVVQQATGEVPKTASVPAKKAALKVAKHATKKPLAPKSR